VDNVTNKTLPEKYPREENLSADGTIITGSVVGVAGEQTYMPFNYNIETGETVAVSSVTNALGSFTLPSGEIFYNIMQGASPYDTYVYDGAKSSSLYDWLYENYNVTVDKQGLYAIRDCSASGKVMVGHELVGPRFIPVIISL
jgi:hypothetical protein